MQTQVRFNLKKIHSEKAREEKRKRAVAAKVMHDENCLLAELDCQLCVNLYPDATF